MNINARQRIGVVASALWVIGAAIYERTGQVGEAITSYKNALGNCLPEFTHACTDAAHEKYRGLLSLHFVSVSNIVYIAIGPVLLGWVLAYLIVKIARWVKAGF